MKVSLLQTDDGSHSLIAHSDKGLSQSYHSHRGAIQESRHVFIDAGLKVVNNKSISILEVGFGTGLNAFITYKESEATNSIVRYHAVELSPISMEIAGQLNYPTLLNASPLVFSTMHKSMHSGTLIPIQLNFEFIPHRIALQDLELPSESIDLIYFDAFSPDFQPELWKEDVFRKIYGWMRPGAILVTYCAQSAMQRAMKAVGFLIEKLPGALGKREMVRARKQA